MKNKTVPQDRYYVMQITRNDALAKLQEQDNVRRKNPNVSYAFGMYDRDRANRLTAVVTFGSPPSPTICVGLCGEDEKLNILELNSLWADTSVSNDAVVYFIKESMRRVPKDIILSYVSTENERICRVYKMLGFTYTGLTKARTNRVSIDGVIRHNRSKDYTFENTYIVPRPRKHRFVMFNAEGIRKKDLVDKLRYDVYSY